MLISTASAIIIIVYHFASTMAFCNMHAASETQKYMMLHSQPNTKILVNHMIDKYSKTSGVPSFYIKDCIENKKKAINAAKPKPKPAPTLRGNIKKGYK
jgi:hypothetical protein